MQSFSLRAVNKTLIACFITEGIAINRAIERDTRKSSNAIRRPNLCRIEFNERTRGKESWSAVVVRDITASTTRYRDWKCSFFKNTYRIEDATAETSCKRVSRSSTRCSRRFFENVYYCRICTTKWPWKTFFFVYNFCAYFSWYTACVLIPLRKATSVREGILASSSLILVSLNYTLLKWISEISLKAINIHWFVVINILLIVYLISVII